MFLKGTFISSLCRTPRLPVCPCVSSGRTDYNRTNEGPSAVEVEIRTRKRLGLGSSDGLKSRILVRWTMEVDVRKWKS